MKRGICLTGGGARGAYQIGALTALKELGYLSGEISFAGTSIGAANAALVASSSLENAKDIWFHVPTKSLEIARPFMEKFSKEKLKIFMNGLHSMDDFEEILIKHVNLDQLKKTNVYVTISEVGDAEKGFRNMVKSTIDHYLTHESKAHYVLLSQLKHSEEVKDTIMASCSIPFVFPSIQMDGKRYYDGGVFDNIPVKPLVDEGCEEIIIIHLNKMRWFTPKKYPHVQFHEIIHQHSLGTVLRFSPSNAKKLFEYGYQDAMNYFNLLSNK
jgi:NTE family protein